MNLIIRRRRFGQIALTSAATAVLTNFIGKASAQSYNMIYGVRFTISSQDQASDTINNNIGRILKPSESKNITNTVPGISIMASNLETGKQISDSRISPDTVDNQNVRAEVTAKASFSQPIERLTSLTALTNGRFMIACVAHTQKGNFTRLMFTNSNQPSSLQTAVKVWGFKQENSTLESIGATKDGKMICIVSPMGGIPPFELATIDPQTGKISYDDLALPDLQVNRSYRHLTQSPDGKIYATSMGREGGVFLVQLDMENKSMLTGKPIILKLLELSYDKQSLESDLLSLAISPSGQMYALAAPNARNVSNNEPINSLFSVNQKTGEMTLIRKFPVDKITFAL